MTEPEQPVVAQPLRAALNANGWYVADVIDCGWVESSGWEPVMRAALAVEAVRPASRMPRDLAPVTNNERVPDGLIPVPPRDPVENNDYSFLDDEAAVEAVRPEPRGFDVTDPDDDAPDGARMLFERHRGRWEPAVRPETDIDEERLARALLKDGQVFDGPDMAMTRAEQRLFAANLARAIAAAYRATPTERPE